MLLESNERTCTLGRFQRPETRSCELERREREREKEGGGERERGGGRGGGGAPGHLGHTIP